jgi:hypothetical protein
MEHLYQTSDSVTLSIYVNGRLQNADVVNNVHQVFVTITYLVDNSAVVTGQLADHVGAGIYEYILTTLLNSKVGKYKSVWLYTVDGVVNTKIEYYDVVVPYTTAQEVKDTFLELEDKSNEEIYRKERMARKIINSVCNDTFSFQENVTKIIRGQNKDTLFLDERIYLLTSVKIDGTDDITTEVEIFDDYWIRPQNAFSRYFSDIKRGIIEASAYFPSSVEYHILGNWGWQYVPEEVSESARLLISDYFNDDYMLHQHGVIVASMGDRTLTFSQDLLGTTGNYDVDVLLSNSINYKVRLI